jgi:hypothetical protein
MPDMQMKMLGNNPDVPGLLSFPRKREFRKKALRKLDSCFRRNDKHIAFSFLYGLSSLMVSRFSLFIEISVVGLSRCDGDS